MEEHTERGGCSCRASLWCEQRKSTEGTACAFHFRQLVTSILLPGSGKFMQSQGPVLKADVFVMTGDVIGEENLHPSLAYLMLL